MTAIALADFVVDLAVRPAAADIVAADTAAPGTHNLAASDMAPHKPLSGVRALTQTHRPV